MAWASDRLILYCPRCCCDCAKGLIHASAKKMLLKALLVVSLLIPFCTSIDTIEMDQHVKDGDLLVSKENIFALGFFSPRNSSSRYVGIWYAQKDEKDQKAVVWVANRNDPIKDSSLITASITLVFRSWGVSLLHHVILMVLHYRRFN
ncbi:unnamed protein product [Malus baccata var. baccata]